MSIHIGYLTTDGTDKVMCRKCGEDPTLPHKLTQVVSLYDVNIGQYRQSCHTCGKVMMPGQPCGGGDKCPRLAEGAAHTHWCELYPPPGILQKATQQIKSPSVDYIQWLRAL